MHYVHYSVDAVSQHNVYCENDGLIMSDASYKLPYFRTWQDRALSFWLGAEGDTDNV